ncbi:MAG: 3-phosphoshikimate 1-carboxyvinyltransferase [Saprospiraceae bacterium]|nr:3-phosphoshikimate 1-carboxyvinyltransferase [Saprospiraceae bacterium]
MESIKIYCPVKNIKGEITLSGSKSISNRVLLIKALCSKPFSIHNLSDCDDTVTMDRLLKNTTEIFDAHHAGTTFRFLTAYLATQQSSQIITGSERMKNRPIGTLVDALNFLGADIQYMGKVGYPPLKINPPGASWKKEITLSANISSQYITALLLIAPSLPEGLTINLEGQIVSRPYIEMTIRIMKYFGVLVDWQDQKLTIKHQPYIEKDYYVEADWSAASYFYIIAGLSETAEIKLIGLNKDSLQGDASILNICTKFGIESSYEENALLIKKRNVFNPIDNFEYDFINVPDIAQSVSLMCAGLGINCLFSGLQTLKIKETDRIFALQNELSKINVFLHKMPEKFSKKTGIEYFFQEGKATVEPKHIPTIDTYDDHRMAMSFATLGMIFPVCIQDSKVVSKSYPGYWKDLSSLGFNLDIK